jgi:hypothetical protein
MFSPLIATNRPSRFAVAARPARNLFAMVRIGTATSKQMNELLIEYQFRKQKKRLRKTSAGYGV